MEPDLPFIELDILPSTGGRPKYNIDCENLTELLDCGFFIKEIAKLYDVSMKTGYNRIEEFGIASTHNVSDEELLEVYVF